MDKNKSPIVGVVGLTPAQEQEIAKSYPELDLRFWGLDDSWVKLDSIADRSKVVFVHVRHINHKVDASLKSRNAPCVAVRGGMSSIKKAITNWRSTCTI